MTASGPETNGEQVESLELLRRRLDRLTEGKKTESIDYLLDQKPDAIKALLEASTKEIGELRDLIHTFNKSQEENGVMLRPYHDVLHEITVSARSGAVSVKLYGSGAVRLFYDR